MRWERVLALFDEEEKAVHHIRAFDTESKIKENCGLVLSLLEKLDTAYQEEWGSIRAKGVNNPWPVLDIFFEFLSDKNNTATQSRMRVMSEKAKTMPIAVPQLGDGNGSHQPHSGHHGKASDNIGSGVGPSVRPHLTLAQIKTKEELNRYVAGQKAAFGPCSCCNKSHSFERNFPSLGQRQILTRR